MIEAMACGTPVIAFNNGSVPEILEDGVTGFIVHTMTQAIFVVSQLKYLSRIKIRQTFEKRFTAKRMAEDYINVYHSLINVSLKRVYRNGNIKLNEQL